MRNFFLGKLRDRRFVSLGILVLVIITILLLVDQVQQRQNVRSKAEEDRNITFLTQQLLQYKENYEHPKVGILSNETKAREGALVDMESIALERKAILQKEAKEDPEAFLTHAILADKRDEFPQEIKNNIEEKLSNNGTLTYIHMDYANDVSKDVYTFFPQDSAEQKTINFAHPPSSSIASDQKVRIEGIALDSEVVVNDYQPKIESNQPSELSVKPLASGGYLYLPFNAKGNQKVLVLLVNFIDNPQQTTTLDETRHLVFGNDASTNDNTSLAAYYKENSYGQLSLSGEVVGWYTVSPEKTESLDVQNCLVRSWAKAADQKAKDAGIAVDDYLRKIYVIAKNNPCGPGLAGMTLGVGGISTTQAWVFSGKNKSVFAHELGHNLGMTHASSITCSQGDYTESRCQLSEYGDITDVMGGGQGTSHFSAPHKITAGWLPQDKILTITKSGIYTLSPLESLGSSYMAIKINKTDASNNYYLEYRQPIGFDSFFADSITRGITIHFWNDDNQENPQLLTLQSGNVGGFSTITLRDGDSFNDTKNTITIKQLSHAINGATIEVSLPQKTLSMTKWSTLNPLPVPLNSQAIVSKNGIIYSIGGTSSDGFPTASIYRSNIVNNTLNAWSLAGNLPEQVSLPSASEYNGNIYVANATSILKGKIQEDGSVATFTNVEEIPDTFRTIVSIIAQNGYLYAIGQLRIDDDRTDVVYSAKINPDGTIEKWQKIMEASLPTSLVKEEVIAHKGYIYVLGGRTGYNHILAQKTVYVAKIKENGGFEQWKETSSLPVPLTFHRVIVFGEYMVVVGGLNENNLRQSDLYAAKINSDGVLDRWYKLDEPLPKGLYSPGLFAAENTLFVMGGGTKSDIQSTVYSTIFTLPAAIPTPTTIPSPTPTPLQLTKCRSISCVAPPADCHYEDAIISSCDNNVQTTCGRVVCNNESAPVPTTSSCANSIAALSWSGNFDHYKLRVDNTSDAWDGTCTSLKGDFCNDTVTGNTISFQANPGTYNWWIHGVTQSGTVSEITSKATFTCTASAEQQNPTYTCLGNGQARLSWPSLGTDHYALRIDDTIDGWNGTCSSGAGDSCPESRDTSYTFGITPGHTYNWWYHGADTGNNLGVFNNGTQFSCNN